MVYEPVSGLDNIVKRFKDVSDDSTNHFVEGLQYSLDEAMIMTATMIPDHEVEFTMVINILINFSSNESFSNNFSRLMILVNGTNRGSSNTLKVFWNQRQKVKLLLNICHWEATTIVIHDQYFGNFKWESTVDHNLLFLENRYKFVIVTHSYRISSRSEIIQFSVTYSVG